MNAGKIMIMTGIHVGLIITLYKWKYWDLMCHAYSLYSCMKVLIHNVYHNEIELNPLVSLSLLPCKSTEKSRFWSKCAVESAILSSENYKKKCKFSSSKLLALFLIMYTFMYIHYVIE